MPWLSSFLAIPSCHPVNCSAKYKSPVTCVSPNEHREKVIDMLEQRAQRINFLGYVIVDSEDSTMLARTFHGCQEGFNYFIDYVCLSIIPFLEDIPPYATCIHETVWETLSDIGNNKFCEDDNRKNIKIVNKFDSVCKDHNALMPNYVPPDVIQLILDEVLPQPFVAIHRLTGINAWRSTSGEICSKHTKCKKYPQNHILFALDQVDVNIPHYVICERQVDDGIIPPKLPGALRIFSCGEHLIPFALTCDGKADCPKGADEQQCSYVCTGTLCFSHCPFPACTCHHLYYQCEKGGCVPFGKFCDNTHDCPLGDDEVGCRSAVTENYDNVTYGLVTHATKCTGRLLPCRNGIECYSIFAVCQYDTIAPTGQLSHCTDGTHLTAETACYHTVCLESYKCRLSYCIPLRKVCDGVIDCPNGDDEASCANITCPGLI